MKIHKNRKKIVKNQKIVNVKNHYKLLEIQPIPYYLILMPILQAYHPVLRHNILNIHHRAMKLCIHKGYL